MNFKVLKSKIDFTAEVFGIDARQNISHEQKIQLTKLINEYAVIILKNQKINDDEQIKFSENFGFIEPAGTNTELTKITDRRLSLKMNDVSNLDKNNKPLTKSNQNRIFGLGNRLWHTDASFKKIPVTFSILSGRKVSSKGGETEFCDMRCGYKALSNKMKNKVESLIGEHSLQYSRGKLGFIMKDVLTNKELKKFKPVLQPLVRKNYVTDRKSLYLSAHLGLIKDWELADSILFINDLMEICTRPDYIYSHKWEENDLVIWDNTQVMHRGRYFNDQKEIRDVRRTTIAGTEMLIDQ
ncbi:MAG: TauD/TfdA dioxygenase family protein [Candidatus Puniceispirillales bacterium]|jgi:alpha-ketoglutarate-dependent 2,4-dichlorophenoxyacetate dioxygenase|tara:strand:+ start:5358 stop:6248 length:891 start_codon:yes stop_codon:yes gene_type:complete